MSQPKAEFLDNAIFLVDASSYIFRAYYAIQTELKAPDGTPTHATYGFMQMIHSLLSSYKVKNCALIWDRPGKGFRHALFPEYKANRSKPPEDLGIQIENSKKSSELVGLKQLEAEGFEADDIIAAIVRNFPEHNFVIVTADKDLLQLVGPRCWCLDTYKNKFSNHDEAIEKFGVPPEKIVEIQALCGDSVDNIPGAPGIGPKGAQELIKYYGSLKALLEAAEKRESPTPPTKDDPLKGKKFESIKNNIALINTSLELVSLNSEAPRPRDIGDFLIHNPQKKEFMEWSQRLGLEKLATRIISDIESIPLMSSSDAKPDPASSPTPQAKDWKATCVSSNDQLQQILDQNLKSSLMSMDTETRSLESRQEGNLVGISFSFDVSEGFYIPLRHSSGTNLETQKVLKMWADFFQKSSLKEVIFQNAKFDLAVFCSENFKFPEALKIQDTMIASFLIDPGGSHGMDALSQKFLSYTPLSFDEVLGEHKSFDQVDLEKATFYSAEDAVVTLKLWFALSEELQKLGLTKLYDKVDLPLVKVLQHTEQCGVKLNPDMLKLLSNRFHEQLQKIENEAIALLKKEGCEIGPDFNLSSPKQIATILFEKLGLPILKKGKTGPSTDVSVLEELAEQHPFPKLLLEVRELSKLLSTYIDSFPKLIDPKTQRLHTSLSQTVAVTGRLASSNPNLQNIPIKTERGREIRESFEAEKGHLLVGADYSQVELRILAHITNDPKLVDAFNSGGDIHRRTASLILEKPEDQVNDEDRRLAKTINFGIIYGQTPFGLSKTLGIPRSVAQTFIENYFKTYPGIKNYMTEVVEKARVDGYVETLFGRRRYLTAINSRNVPLKLFAERTAVNSPIQGTAADLIKLAMIECSDFLSKNFPKSHLVLQVHDELIIESPESEAESVLKELKRIMEKPSGLKDFGVEFKVPIKVDAAIGWNWGEI